MVGNSAIRRGNPPEFSTQGHKGHYLSEMRRQSTLIRGVTCNLYRIPTQNIAELIDLLASNSPNFKIN